MEDVYEYTLETKKGKIKRYEISVNGTVTATIEKRKK
jgi:hypothetical protein